MNIKIERISQIVDDKIDYNSLVFVVRSDKKIFFENTNEIAALLKLLIEGGVLKIIVDLKDLEVIDSSGIGIFINAVKNIRDRNGDIIFINIPSELDLVFDVIKFKSFVKVFSSEVEAINKFRYIK